MIRTTPFWQDDISDQLLKGVISPIDVVESSIELTESERKNLVFNSLFADSGVKFLTIYTLDEIPKEYHPNLLTMTQKLNRLEEDYNYNLLCTSFFRSRTHHLRVYAAKGIIDVTKIPMLSNHLTCLAGDMVPQHKPVKHLHDFLTEEKLEQHGLWMEHPLDTPAWAHLQGVAHKSWTPGASRKYRIKK